MITIQRRDIETLPLQTFLASYRALAPIIGSQSGQADQVPQLRIKLLKEKS